MWSKFRIWPIELRSTMSNLDKDFLLKHKGMYAQEIMMLLETNFLYFLKYPLGINGEGPCDFVA